MRIEESQELKSRLASGGRRNPFWIIGPCILEDREVQAEIAETLCQIRARHGIEVVFKASFDKANRTSIQSFRGKGMDSGLEELLWIKSQFGLPILTDIHETVQAPAVSEVVDIIQIPAFLCRQTDLLEAACSTHRLINVKKGQFLAPSQIKGILEKLEAFGSVGHWITERGVSFGYQRLVVDFAGFPEMLSLTQNLILDVTHSVQMPGSQGSSTGGNRIAIPTLAKAGATTGLAGFFAETHPDPDKALSDGPNALPLKQLEEIMVRCKAVAEAANG